LAVDVSIAASLPEWLTAIGGLGAFGATAVLARLGYKQMGALTAQAEAARIAQQPRVLAQPTSAVIRGPNSQFGITGYQVAFPYRLTNEGGGVAFNIRHGIEAAGVEYVFGGGGEIRAIGPGLSVPPVDSAMGGFTPLTVPVTEHDLPAGWDSSPWVCWARYEDAFGQRWESRNSIDPEDRATFERIPNDRR
jgi:hypothetical protein